MRVLVAGAGGVIGRHLLPLLARSHDVVGLTRSARGAAAVEALGATAVVADALDAPALARAVAAARPDAVVNQLTAIPARVVPRRIPAQFALTNRLRTEGTRNLLEASAACGAGRHVAQSMAFAYRPDGDGLKTEDDPLYTDAPADFRPNVRALAELEALTRGAGGVVLRYGHLYGEGTIYARDGETTRQIARRRLPVVGRGRGRFSFVHAHDAAAATVAALALDRPATLNVVDDDPAPVAAWISEIARLVGAGPPRRVPAGLARVVAGRWTVEYMDQLRGASNARAREHLHWTPRHPSWRDGFARELRGSHERRTG